MRFLLLRLFSLCFLFAGASSLQAQLEVKLSFERESYVSLEPIEAVVTIRNNVGKDVVLGGAGGASWLNFQAHDTSGIPVSVIRAVDVPPLVLRNGETLQRKFQLDRHYFLSETGTYIVRAAAYFPELEKHNVSRPVRFNILQPRPPVWQEVFAMPGGKGGYRRFQVFLFNDTKKTFVYLSVVDEGTKMVMSRTPLGSVMVEKDVQPALDQDKNLHLIYLSSPTLYVYQQIDPGGRVADRKFYLTEKGQPKLIKEPSGKVSILGGVLYDPLAQPQTPAFRKLSDRPPGLSR